MKYDARTPAEYLALLEPALDVGKGCIRFKKSRAVADTRIEEFIKKAMTMLRNGEEFGC